MSLNLSQIFVKYPDERDAAEILAMHQKRDERSPAFIVLRTFGPWLAVSAHDNDPPPEAARLLSRALEAPALWYGLAGSALAYRLLRYQLGRETEHVQEPRELFEASDSFPLPEYADAEKLLYERLRMEGVPRAYVYLFTEEIGAAGGKPEDSNAVVIRRAGCESFTHRVPPRGKDGVRTLFDAYREDEQRVYEQLRLQGRYDETRARLLIQTLEHVCRRRVLPPGWKVRYLASGDADPDLPARLAQLHAKGRFSYELIPASA